MLCPRKPPRRASFANPARISLGWAGHAASRSAAQLAPGPSAMPAVPSGSSLTSWQAAVALSVVGRNTRPGVGAQDVAAPSSGQVVGTAQWSRTSREVSGTHLDLVAQAHVRLWTPLRAPASRLRATDSGRAARRCARQGSGTALRSLAGGGGGSGGVGAARAASRAAGGRPRSHRRPTAQRSPLRRPCQPPAPRPPLPHTQPAGHSSAPLLLGGRAGRRDRAHDLVRRVGWFRLLGHGLGGLRSASAGVRAGR